MTIGPDAIAGAPPGQVREHTSFSAAALTSQAATGAANAYISAKASGSARISSSLFPEFLRVTASILIPACRRLLDTLFHSLGLKVGSSKLPLSARLPARRWRTHEATTTRTVALSLLLGEGRFSNLESNALGWMCNTGYMIYTRAGRAP